MQRRFFGFWVCFAVILTMALSSFVRADEGLSRRDSSASASKVALASYENAYSVKEVRGQSSNLRESTTLSPSFDQRSTFSGDLSSLRLDQECDRFGAESGQSSAFYLKIEGRYGEAYFIVCTLHGILKNDTITPVSIEWLSLTTSKGERFAFDDGRGSAARRKELERRGIVAKTTRFIKLDGRPFKLEREDVVVFKLEQLLSDDLVPLVSGSLDDVEVGDPIAVLTATETAIGQVRFCHAEDLNFLNDEGLPRLRFLSTSLVDNNALKTGDSGAPLVDANLRVVAVLLQIKDIGVSTLDGNYRRVVSNDGLAVKIDAIVDQIVNHWNF